MSVQVTSLLQVLVPGALWAAGEERPDAEDEEEDLQHEDGDCGVVCEPLCTVVSVG